MIQTYRPEILTLSNHEDVKRVASLRNDPYVHKYDTIYQQLEELIKIKYPSSNFSLEQTSSAISDHLNGRDISSYGVWVYYPWSARLVHTLGEEEFYAVRTNRNQLKITAQEQRSLKNKTVGIIGLSVGQSVALTMAMERVCGKIKLADFDTAELSNLNRIRTGIHNLNINKTVIAAREIAEIDPFIDVEIFPEGLNLENMDSFMNGGSKLDVLVEVCDGIDIKLKSRMHAKALGIPVVMETNDKCMLDIERFDLDPNYPILHGLVDQKDLESLDILQPSERMRIIKKIVSVENLSARMLDSFAELGKSIRSWPQLASSVMMGAAISTEVTRKILLGEPVSSGRCYFDVDEFLVQNSILSL